MITLYRPVGLRELELIMNSSFKAFPPRLPEQPIFYPVLKVDYAIQIASDWNVKYGSGNAGFVTEFEMDGSYIKQFKVQIVGASMHKELWIPSEKLTEFNANMIGSIKVVKAYYGEKYTGIIPNEGQLKGKIASDQIVQLYQLLITDIEKLNAEMELNSKILISNYKYWELNDFSSVEILEHQKLDVLHYIDTYLKRKFPNIEFLNEKQEQE